MDKIGYFDGVGNICCVLHDQEHINSIEYGVACDVNFYDCHKVTQDFNSPLSLAQDLPDDVFYDRLNVQTLGYVFNKMVTLFVWCH